MKHPFTTPVEALRQHTERQPDKLAYLFLDQGEIEADRMTYAELDRTARSIAVRLRGLAEPGERVLLLYSTGLDFVRAMYGCLYAGLIPIPANPPRLNRPATRLYHIVNDCQASLALTTADFIADLPQRFEQIPELEQLKWIDHSSFADGGDEPWQSPDLSPDSLAFIQYTSGSTAFPRGVMINYRNLSYNRHVILLARRREQMEGAVILNWAPMFHDMGLITGVFQCMFDGSLSVMMSPVAFLQKPARWLQAISKYRASASGGPNFCYDLCVDKIPVEEREGLDLSCWKTVWNSAEPIRAETQDRFAREFSRYGFEYESFLPGYGLAEATLLVSVYSGRKEATVFKADRAALEKNSVVASEATESEKVQILPSSGRPLLDLEIAIVNHETLERCPPDEVGEIWVSGENISEGYWNRPEESQRLLHASIAGTGEGSFLRTGDLGFMHDGELYVTGRLKDMIIVRGRNYYPQDVEITVQNSHPALREGRGAAFSIQVDDLEHLVVVQEVEREARNTLDPDEVFKAVRMAIARNQGIRAYAVALIKPYSLPITSSGKIMRNETKRQFLEGELNVIAEWQPDLLQQA